MVAILGLRLAEALLVVRVSSSAVRAWIWRWIAAGFRSVSVSFMIVLSGALTSLCRSARRCGVVGTSYFLVTFAPSRTLGDQFLLGQEVVRHLRLQHPDLVQQQQFCGCVVAVVADHGAHHRPVLLLDRGRRRWSCRDGTG